MTNRKLKGERFRGALADSNVLWEVKRSCGRDVFECVVVNEPVEFEGQMLDSDFAGRRDVFSRTQIEMAMRLLATREELPGEAV